MNKKTSRLRRARLTRAKIAKTDNPRLVVHRTPRHIYVQCISACGSKVLAQSSTLDKNVRADLKYTGNIEAAKLVGKTLALRLKEVGIQKVAFDRSGFKYHGRIQALADAVREGSIDF
jgi:large subunit ribosomal protein L18